MSTPKRAKKKLYPKSDAGMAAFSNAKYEDVMLKRAATKGSKLDLTTSRVYENKRQGALQKQASTRYLAKKYPNMTYDDAFKAERKRANEPDRGRRSPEPRPIRMPDPTPRGIRMPDPTPRGRKIPMPSREPTGTVIQDGPGPGKQGGYKHYIPDNVGGPRSPSNPPMPPNTRVILNPPKPPGLPPISNDPRPRVQPTPTPRPKPGVPTPPDGYEPPRRPEPEPPRPVEPRRPPQEPIYDPKPPRPEPKRPKPAPRPAPARIPTKVKASTTPKTRPKTGRAKVRGITSISALDDKNRKSYRKL